MEIYFDDRIVIVEQNIITKLQAQWRGWLVRKHMRSIKTVYEDIYLEIEGCEPHSNSLFDFTNKLQLLEHDTMQPERDTESTTQDEILVENGLVSEVSNENVKASEEVCIELDNVGEKTASDDSNEKTAMEYEAERKQVILELLWIQQAINSRKQYLNLKKNIS